MPTPRTTFCTEHPNLPRQETNTRTDLLFDLVDDRADRVIFLLRQNYEYAYTTEEIATATGAPERLVETNLAPVRRAERTDDTDLPWGEGAPFPIRWTKIDGQEHYLWEPHSN